MPYVIKRSAIKIVLGNLFIILIEVYKANGDFPCISCVSLILLYH